MLFSVLEFGKEIEKGCKNIKKTIAPYSIFFLF